MNVYVRRHKNATLHAYFCLKVNYCIFANGNVSIRFNREDDNVVLEYCIKSAQTKEIVVHYIFQPHHILIYA